jgi:hypothetical protein
MTASCPYCWHSAIEVGVCRGPGYSRDDRLPNVRRADGRHAAGGAAPRQGDQFWDHLRHFRLGLANQLGISREEASAYIKRYFERFPGIRAYMDQTRAIVRERGYVTMTMVEAPHPYLQLAVPLQVDAKAAQNWDEAH